MRKTETAHTVSREPISRVSIFKNFSFIKKKKKFFYGIFLFVANGLKIGPVRAVCKGTIPSLISTYIFNGHLLYIAAVHS